MAIHRELGMGIADSHVYILEDGKHGGGRLSDTFLQSKKDNDPHTLLNPGKIRNLN
jgi:hypothetical protein